MSDPLTVRLAPPTEHERMLAMLAHLLGILGWAVVLGGVICPAVIYWVKKDDSKFVAFHALQTVCFQFAVLLAAGAFTFGIFCFLIGIPLLILLGAGVLVFGAFGLIAAYQGQWSRYPIVGTWALEHVLGPQLDRGTPA